MFKKETFQTHVQKERDLIKDVIHGGLDGTITTFAIVSGVAGAALGAGVTIAIGFANLFAHGLATGISYYLGEDAEKKYVERERAIKTKDLLSHFEQTEEELEKYYTKKHYSKADAEKIVLTLGKHKRVLAETALDEEFHLSRVDSSPFKTGFLTFLSFVVFGFIPLFSYIVSVLLPEFQFDSFIVATGLTMGTIFGLGMFKAVVSDKQLVKSGIQVVILGGIAAIIAFYVGSKLSHFI